jgi:hypothetical protein
MMRKLLLGLSPIFLLIPFILAALFSAPEVNNSLNLAPPPPIQGKIYARNTPTIYNPGGPTINFLVYKPGDSASPTKHPLIIFAHGDGERLTPTIGIATNSGVTNSIPGLCNQGASMQFTVNSTTSSFYVLAPQCPGSDGFKNFYFKDMWTWAVNNLNVDTTRVYVVGLSYGGGLAWSMMLDSTHWIRRIAAIATQSGIAGGDRAVIKANMDANNVASWAFAADDDGTVNPDAGAGYYLGQFGYSNPNYRFTFYTTGNHSAGWNNSSDTGHATKVVDSSNRWYFPLSKSTTANLVQNPNLYEFFLSYARAPVLNPNVNSGSDQTVTLPTSSVNLSGSATPVSPYNIANYVWTKVSGPSGGTITSPTATSTTVTALTAGTYIFRLTATDDATPSPHSGNDDVQITVNSQNPTANAGGDQTITLPINSTTLTGSGSPVSPATISSYSWTKFSGPSTGTIVSPGLQNTNLTNLVAGIYIFRLTVTDNNGLTGTDDVQVTVNASSGYPGGLDSQTIGGRRCFVKIPVEDPAYTSTTKYPLILEIGDQNENLANNPSGLSGLNKSGTVKLLYASQNIYPLSSTGTPIYYIMVKVQPQNYGDMVFANEITPWFTGVLSTYSNQIDTSKYSDGTYQHILLAGTERGADAFFNVMTFDVANGFGSTPPTWTSRIKKVVTSRVNNINNGQVTSPTVLSTFTKRKIRYWEPNDGNTLPARIKDSINKYSPSANQRLFVLTGLSNSQVYDSMWSVKGTDSNNIYRILIDDLGTPGIPNYSASPKDLFDISNYAVNDPNHPSNWFDAPRALDPKNGVNSVTVALGQPGYKYDTTEGQPSKLYGTYFPQGYVDQTWYSGNRGCNVIMDMVGTLDPSDTSKKFVFTDIYALNGSFDNGITMYFYNLDKQLLSKPLNQREIILARPDSLMTPFATITTTSSPGQWLSAQSLTDSCRWVMVRMVLTGGKTSVFKELKFYGHHNYDTLSAVLRGDRYTGPLPSKKTPEYTFDKTIGTNHTNGSDTLQQIGTIGPARYYVGLDYHDTANAASLTALYPWTSGDVNNNILLFHKRLGTGAWYTMQGASHWQQLHGNNGWNLNNQLIEPTVRSNYTRDGKFWFNVAALYGSVNVNTNKTIWIGNPTNGRNSVKILEIGNEVEAHGATYQADWARTRNAWDSAKAADPNIKIAMAGMVAPDTMKVKAFWLFSNWFTADKVFPADIINFHKYYSNRDKLPIGQTFDYNLQIGMRMESAEAWSGQGQQFWLDRISRVFWNYVDTSHKIIFTESGGSNWGRPPANIGEAGAQYDLYTSPRIPGLDSVQSKSVLMIRKELLLPFTSIAWYNDYAWQDNFGDSVIRPNLFYSYGTVTNRNGSPPYDQRKLYPMYYVRGFVYRRLTGWYADSTLKQADSTGLWLVRYRKIGRTDSACYVAWKGSYDGTNLTNQNIFVGAVNGNSAQKGTPSFSSLYPTTSTVTVTSGNINTIVNEMPTLFFVQEAGGNQGPVANAGPNQTILPPTSTATLDGSGSFDPDGTISAYSWVKTSGPSGGTITSPSTVQTGITGLNQGVYVFTLTVTDNNSVSNSASVQITVNTPPNVVISANPDTLVVLNTNTVTLIGSASTDPDGTISSYSWIKLVGPSGGNISSPNSANTNIIGLSQGVYVYQLTAVDNNGASSSKTIRITVLPQGTYYFNERVTLIYENSSHVLVVARNIKLGKTQKGAVTIYVDYTTNSMFDPKLIYTQVVTTIK